MYFMAVKKSRKRSGFVIFSCLKDSAFTAVKRDAKVLTRYVKGHLFSVEGKRNGEPFLSKSLDKRVRGQILGWSLPV